MWVSKKPLKPVDTVINGNSGFQLCPGSLYMVKLHPTITCATHQGDKSIDGKVVSIILVTGKNLLWRFSLVVCVRWVISTVLLTSKRLPTNQIVYTVLVLY